MYNSRKFHYMRGFRGETRNWSIEKQGIVEVIVIMARNSFHLWAGVMTSEFGVNHNINFIAHIFPACVVELWITVYCTMYPRWIYWKIFTKDIALGQVTGDHGFIRSNASLPNGNIIGVSLHPCLFLFFLIFCFLQCSNKEPFFLKMT